MYRKFLLTAASLVALGAMPAVAVPGPLQTLIEAGSITLEDDLGQIIFTDDGMGGFERQTGFVGAGDLIATVITVDAIVVNSVDNDIDPPGQFTGLILTEITAIEDDGTTIVQNAAGAAAFDAIFGFSATDFAAIGLSAAQADQTTGVFFDDDLIDLDIFADDFAQATTDATTPLDSFSFAMGFGLEADDDSDFFVGNSNVDVTNTTVATLTGFDLGSSPLISAQFGQTVLAQSIGGGFIVSEGQNGLTPDGLIDTFDLNGSASIFGNGGNGFANADFDFGGDFDISFTAIPVPGSLALLGASLIRAGISLRRRKA